ncbi:MAG: hypothetical protein GY862_08460 [Gammaproteobacteria bacterium]|nr:hypothetical protein [Gammaproteobacteria bacterium]
MDRSRFFLSTLFRQRYNGRFSGILRWPQLDTLWAGVRKNPEGWYAYFVNEELPPAPLDATALDRFVNEVDALLRKDHDYDYCGIVYADALESPSMIKIFDPNNLGASCGSSGRVVPPRWLLSRIRPEPIVDEAPVPRGRIRWWKRIFQEA